MTIPHIISAKITAAMCIICTLLGCLAVWYVQELRIEAKISTLKTEHADEKATWDREKIAITTKAQQDTAEALERQKQAQAAAAAADKDAQEKLANAERENAALRYDVATGNKRVRILEANLATANLAARQHAAGGSASASSVGDGEGAELTAEAGSIVLDIRAGIQRRETKIEYLQSYINDVVKQCKR